MPLKPHLRFGLKIGLCFDLLIAIFAGLWIALTEFGYVPNSKQGFYCEIDDKITYKYTGDTIPAAVIAISAAIPILIMLFVEILRYDGELSKAIKLRKTFREALFWTREYFVGFTIQLFIVETLKVVIGELRPHFLDTCKPDAAFNCTQGSYITEYECTNTKDGFYLVSDSSRSFPSGHSSIAFYEGVFLAWYLLRRFPRSKSVLLLPFMLCLCLTWAFTCGATRVMDNRHHWWDVLIGDILGGVFAILTCTLLCKDFRMKSSIPDHLNQNGHTSVRRLLSDASCKEERDIAMAQA